jgi:hypothetical protein
MNEMPTPTPPLDWLRMIIVASFAALGGSIGYVLRAMDAGDPVSFQKALIEFVAAGFVGALSGLLCAAWGFSIIWSTFIAGTFGLLGARASTQVMQRFVWAKLGLNRRSQDDPAD